MDTTSTQVGDLSKQKEITPCSIMTPEIPIYIINLYSPTGIIYDPLAGGENQGDDSSRGRSYL